MRTVEGAIALLLRDVRWLALGAAAAALTMLVVLASTPPTYVAVVDVVPRRARTVVSLDTRIQTLSEETAARGTGPDGLPLLGLSTASTERRQALVRLVRSPDVAQMVRDELNDELPSELRDLRPLLRTVKGSAPPRTEMITIQVEAPRAATAERIAQAWARAYEGHVNLVYAAAEANAEGTARLESELGRAKSSYDAAEASLTQFEGTSRLSEYKHLLEARNGSMQQLTKEVMQEKARRLTALYEVAQRIDLLLADAQALLQQIESAAPGHAGSSTDVTLTLLKAQAFASSRPLPASLQLQLPASAAAADPTAQPMEASALVQALQSWKGQVAQEIKGRLLELQVPGGLEPEAALASVSARGVEVPDIERLRQNLAASHDRDLADAVAQLESGIRDLQGRIAEATAQQKNLQQQRDVAWESYTNLLKKSEESRLAQAVGAGKEVTIANRAVVAEPRSRNAAIVLPLSALLGAAVAGTVILLRRSWTATVGTPASVHPGGTPNGAVAPADVPNSFVPHV